MDITQDTVIRDVLVACPAASAVFQKHGLPCPSCMAAETESLAAVASIHGVDVDRLLSELRAFGTGPAAKGTTTHG